MTGLLGGRYKIIESLGIGGCGQTFLAEDTHMPLKRRCVVKQLKPATNDPAAYAIIKERFELEAKILEKLGENNSQIPTLLDYLAENQEFYLAQEWIEGKNLAQCVAESGSFSERALCQVLSSLLSVLEYVHAQHIIHRDIKPENVMLRARDGKSVLIDFGAVKEVVSTVIDEHGRPISTVIIGTPGYMPSEQAAGNPVFASDLYSLGLTAIFLLTGKRPQQLRDAVTGSINWRPHAVHISAGLAAVLEKAIQPSDRKRYQSAREMNAAITKVAANIRINIPVPGKPPIRWAKWLSRRLAFIYASLGVLLLAAGIGALVYFRSLNTFPSVSNSNVAPPKQSGCFLFNDDPTQATVNVRTNCDTKSCDTDPSTIIQEYPNNTEVRINREVTIKAKGKDFSWTQIVIVQNGQTAWAASSKFRCQ